MNNNCKTNCNCSDCVWQRVLKNTGIRLFMKRGKSVSYNIVMDKVVWSNIEKTQKNLYPQSKTNICLCIKAREKGLNPGKYPGTAQSYKWALFNDKKIYLI